MAESIVTPQEIPTQATQVIASSLRQSLETRGLKYPPSVEKKIQDLIAPFIEAVGKNLLDNANLQQKISSQVAQATAQQYINAFATDEIFSQPIDSHKQAQDIINNSNLEIEGEEQLPEFGAVVRPIPNGVSSDKPKENEKNGPPTPPESTDATPVAPDQHTDANVQTTTDVPTMATDNNNITDSTNTETPDGSTAIERQAKKLPGDFNEAGSPVVAPDTSLDTVSVRETVQNSPPTQSGSGAAAPLPNQPLTNPQVPRKIQSQLEEKNKIISQEQKKLESQKKDLRPLETPYKVLQWSHRALIIAIAMMLILALFLAITVVFIELAVPLVAITIWVWRAAAGIKHEMATIEKKLEPKRKDISQTEATIRQHTAERNRLRIEQALSLARARDSRQA